MFSNLRRLIGLIKVTETGDQIRISGLPGTVVSNDIMSMWGSSKIAANMFSHMDGSTVSFNRFFAPDVIYAFQKIIAEKRRGSHVRALKRVVAAMYEHTWLKDTQIEHPNILDFSQLSRLNVELREHQMRFLKIYNDAVPRFKLKGYLVGAGPGTGKTIIGLSLGVCLHADVVVCVVPKNAVYRVWADTIKERFKKIPKFWTSLDGTAPPRGLGFYIVHYDYLEKFVEFIKHSSFHKPLILLDESHNLNELASLRVQKFIELTKAMNCKHVVWESGTPVKALGGELAPLLTTIDDMFDKDAQQRFSAIFGKAASRANDILAARMGRMTYKVNSADVVSGKPIHHRKDVIMPTGQQYTLDAIRLEMRKFITERVEYYRKNMKSYERQYEDILKYFEKSLITREQKNELKMYRSYIKVIRERYDPVALKTQALYCNHYEKSVIMPALPKQMKDQFKNVRSIVKYYMLKVQGEALGQVLGRKRSQCNVEMIPHVGMEALIDGALKKTVIFTSYVNVVDGIADHLKKQGYKPILVYGKTNNELASMVAQFEKDPDANPLIATYASLSSAVPLVMANQMIMMNSPFRSFEYDQATARCFRMGQDSQVYITDVFLDTGKESNISTRSRDILDWSRQQVEEILDFKTPNFALEEMLEPVDGLESIAKALAEPDWWTWACSIDPKLARAPVDSEELDSLILEDA